jgi:hypothetical protein
VRRERSRKSKEFHLRVAGFGDWNRFSSVFSEGRSFARRRTSVRIPLIGLSWQFLSTFLFSLAATPAVLSSFEGPQPHGRRMSCDPCRCEFGKELGTKEFSLQRRAKRRFYGN